MTEFMNFIKNSWAKVIWSSRLANQKWPSNAFYVLCSNNVAFL